MAPRRVEVTRPDKLLWPALGNHEAGVTFSIPRALTGPIRHYAPSALNPS